MDGNIDPAGIVRDLAWLHERRRPRSSAVRRRHGRAPRRARAGAPGSAGVGRGDRHRGAHRRRARIWSWPSRPHRDGAPPAARGSSRRCDEEGRLVRGRRRRRQAACTSRAPAPAGGGGSVPGHPSLGSIGCRRLRDRLGRAGAALRPGARRAHPRRACTASAPIADWSCLVDGSFGEQPGAAARPRCGSTAWIEQVFAEPVTVRSVVVGTAGPARLRSSASTDRDCCRPATTGCAYRRRRRRSMPTSVPARSASFAPVTARRFRLVLSGAAAAQALPPMADGVRLPPVLRRSDAFLVSEFALRSGGRVHSRRGEGRVRRRPRLLRRRHRPASGCRRHRSRRGVST